MIFSGLKKWEICVIFSVISIAAIAGSLENNAAFHMPFWVIPVLYMPLIAVMCLWRPVLALISYPKLRKHGERAVAVVTEYRRVQWGSVGSGVAEVIRYADRNGQKREKLLHTMPMLTQKIGRTYMLYYNAEKEDEFFISPQGFFAVVMWVILWALTELPAVIMLLLYNGG